MTDVSGNGGQVVQLMSGESHAWQMTLPRPLADALDIDADAIDARLIRGLDHFRIGRERC
jgi:hypothetical protein